MRIMITECSVLRNNNDISLDCLRDFGTVDEFENISYEHLLDIAENYDAILCNKVPIDREVITRAKSLKYIGLFATGYNNIDIEFARQRGICVCNAAEYSTEAVAQQVFAYILSHYTKTAEYDAFVKADGWKNSPTFCPIAYSTDELFQKTIGIIGYGSIGKAVERIAIAFGMKPLIYTRTARQGEKFVSLEQLLSASDIVTLHCPLNEQSKKMMNADTFAKMKKGAFFINTSRGGTVDEPALFDALESEHLSGAAVDVLEYEPMSNDCVLQKAKNITITPHVAWAPVSTRTRLVNTVYENLKGFIEGNIKNRVN